MRETLNTMFVNAALATDYDCIGTAPVVTVQSSCESVGAKNQAGRKIDAVKIDRSFTLKLMNHSTTDASVVRPVPTSSPDWVPACG
jgi:hypothetical protein